MSPIVTSCPPPYLAGGNYFSFPRPRRRYFGFPTLGSSLPMPLTSSLHGCFYGIFGSDVAGHRDALTWRPSIIPVGAATRFSDPLWYSRYGAPSLANSSNKVCAMLARSCTAVRDEVFWEENLSQLFPRCCEWFGFSLSSLS